MGSNVHTFNSLHFLELHFRKWPLLNVRSSAVLFPILCRSTSSITIVLICGTRIKDEKIMNSIRTPDKLKLNVNENLKVFQQSFEFYALALGLDDNELRKIALLLTVAGRAARDVYNTFVFVEDEKDKFEAVIGRFIVHRGKTRLAKGTSSETDRVGIH